MPRLAPRNRSSPPQESRHEKASRRRRTCASSHFTAEHDRGRKAGLAKTRALPREAERSEFLENEGYLFLRFWNNEVLANLDGVHETIADELIRTTPTQTLPIKGEGFCEVSTHNLN
jgi:hypothetical protein